MKKDKIYFASDFHLGTPNLKESHLREKKIVAWLDSIKTDAKSIYLVGDIFDFWFEYSKVVPKGFTRLFGKLAELCDEGIDINLIVGNHDMWTKEYFDQEIGLKTYSDRITIEESNKKILVCHGDGLGNKNYRYKFLKQIFRSSICRWLFSRIHPNLGISLAQLWSKASRNKNSGDQIIKHDHLLNYCTELQKKQPIDFYVFGHMHSPIEINVDKDSKYFNTGDWITNFTYLIFHEGKMEIKKWC